MSRTLLKAPFTVCMWLTDYCNLDCLYCYAKPFSGRRMASGRALSLVDEFISIGVFDLTLAGGEPTLHPEVLTIIERCVTAGMRVGLLSNGVALSDQFIANLDQATSARDFIIQISLDSTDPVVNDKTRGKTERVVANLDKLCQTNLDIQLATVVHKENRTTAHKIIEKFYPRIKRFHFLNIQRTASALKHPHLLMNEDETLAFWLNLADFSRSFPEDLFLPSLRIQLRAMGSAKVDPEISLHRQATFDCGVCSAGWTHVNITSDFDVLGCDIAKEHSLMGNCADGSFSSVWYSPTADAVRNQPFPGCYKIPAPDGTRLMDSLKPEFKPASEFQIAT